MQNHRLGIIYKIVNNKLIIFSLIMIIINKMLILNKINMQIRHFKLFQENSLLYP